MIYTLTLNPALDYDMYLDEKIQLGHLNLAKEVNYRAGGKGINVSKLLKNLDIDSVAFGFVAGFVGNYIEENLKSENIKSDFVKIEGNSRINVKLNDMVYETELTGISPIIENKDIEKLIEKIKKLEDGDVLVLAGSIPSTVQKDIYKIISKEVKDKVEIVLDTRGDSIKDNLHNNLLIKPNIHELRDMFGAKLESKEEIVEKCKYFLDKNVKNIIISRGGDGALLINKNTVLEAFVPSGKLINSIGAGDSMVAGFVAGISNNMSVEDSFRLAVSSGSATAYSYGLGSKELIEKLYKQVEIINESY